MFDLGFLYTAGSEAIFAKRRKYDTLQLAKTAFDSEKYNLDFLTNYGLKIHRKNAHDSRSDCLATGLLFKEICDIKINGKE